MDYERSKTKSTNKLQLLKEGDSWPKFAQARMVKIEFREGTVHESGSALSLEPEVLNACNISKAELCHIENHLPPLCIRPKNN